MIGKAYIGNSWHLCNYIDNILYILKNICDKPSFVTQESIKCIDGILCVFFENGEVYYFNLHSCIEETVFSEYYYLLYFRLKE